MIAYDNRDVGLSEKLEDAGAPDMHAVAIAMRDGTRPPVSYALEHMAADAAGLLDALGIERAHIVSPSMGRMIAQLVAADFPQKTLSLTSIMSTTGNQALPRATPEALARLNTASPTRTKDLDGFLASAVAGRQGHGRQVSGRRGQGAGIVARTTSGAATTPSDSSASTRASSPSPDRRRS